MKQYKSDSYIELPMPVTVLPQTIGKRKIEEKKKDPAEASVKKREAKEEMKNEAAPMRKSARMMDKPKPIYDEKEIDKLLKQDQSKDSINVMLAQTYDPERDDPTGWLMSEKLDGVRCYWNGTKMYTRNGNSIFAPAEW